jgi:hypothetical protein
VIDAAEVLAASVMVQKRLGHDTTDQTDLLQRKLLQLPTAVLQQLRRLGAITVAALAGCLAYAESFV